MTSGMILALPKIPRFTVTAYFRSSPNIHSKLETTVYKSHYFAVKSSTH